MTTKTRWGILATGAIARKFAAGVKTSRLGVLHAVGSRSVEAAQQFAAEFEVPHAHASYEALLADPEVDIVYVSTPHPMHAEWAIKAAEAGKHILCEKPMGMNVVEVQTMIDAARKYDVFLMEAFMYRCHPQTAGVVELIRSGAIGEVRVIRATFSFRSEFKAGSRLFTPELGGGGILDVGCYPVSFSRLIAGAAAGKPFMDPKRIEAAGVIGERSGVDEYAVASLEFANGVVAQLACGVGVAMENDVRIYGTGGTMVIPSPWVVRRDAGPSSIFVNGEEKVFTTEHSLYALEADEAVASIAKRQSGAMSWQDTLGNAETLDAWRAKVGMVYNTDQPATGP